MGRNTLPEERSQQRGAEALVKQVEAMDVDQLEAYRQRLF